MKNIVAMKIRKELETGIEAAKTAPKFTPVDKILAACAIQSARAAKEATDGLERLLDSADPQTVKTARAALDRTALELGLS